MRVILLVFAYEGSNDVNSYRSALSWHFNDNSLLKITSNYLTLDELIPIFHSIMK